MAQHCVNIGLIDSGFSAEYSGAFKAQTRNAQTRGIHPMPFKYWPTVFDAGPTLEQHWVNASCLLG